MANGFEEPFVNYPLDQDMTATIVDRTLERLSTNGFPRRYAKVLASEAIRRRVDAEGALRAQLGLEGVAYTMDIDSKYSWITEGMGGTTLTQLALAAGLYSDHLSGESNKPRMTEPLAAGYMMIVDSLGDTSLGATVDISKVELTYGGEVVAAAPYSLALLRHLELKALEDGEVEIHAMLKAFRDAAANNPEFIAATNKWTNSKDMHSGEDVSGEGMHKGLWTLLAHREDESRSTKLEEMGYDPTPYGFSQFTHHYYGIMRRCHEDTSGPKTLQGERGKTGTQWADVEDSHGNIKRFVYLHDSQEMIIAFYTKGYNPLAYRLATVIGNGVSESQFLTTVEKCMTGSSPAEYLHRIDPEAIMVEHTNDLGVTERHPKERPMYPTRCDEATQRAMSKRMEGRRGGAHKDRGSAAAAVAGTAA